MYNFVYNKEGYVIRNGHSSLIQLMFVAQVRKYLLAQVNRKYLGL